MSEPDPRADVYTLAALLSELDRVLHPLLRGARGRVRLGPTFPPPLPSYDGSASPPTGFGGPSTPGPGSRRSASRAASWAPAHESSLPRPQRFDTPAPPPLRTEPAAVAGSIASAASPASEAEAGSSKLPAPGAQRHTASGNARTDERAPSASSDQAAPTRPPAPRHAGGHSPHPLDRTQRTAEMAERPRTPAPASVMPPPLPLEPPQAALPPRLPPPIGAPQPRSAPLPTRPVRAAEHPRTELPRAAPAAQNTPPALPLDALPPRIESDVAPQPERLKQPQPSLAPEASLPVASSLDASSPEDAPKASVEFHAFATEDETFASVSPSLHPLPRPLALLALRRGGRLSLSSMERQRVIHKLNSAFLDRALMRHR